MTLMAGGQGAPKVARTTSGSVSEFPWRRRNVLVIWLREYPDEAGHQSSLKTRLESPEFKAVPDEMKTLISDAELGIWEQN
jgi:hypothetical protein